ncbi:hypothetical protein CLU83_0050 [Flavobacterium sp. 1]|nr:hypothetical protein CLU83_0050 [Flavobacterium sp. 1]
MPVSEVADPNGLSLSTKIISLAKDKPDFAHISQSRKAITSCFIFLNFYKTFRTSRYKIYMYTMSIVSRKIIDKCFSFIWMNYCARYSFN